MTLWDISVGGTATVTSIALEELLVKRICAMGIRCGSQVTVIRRAAFNGPIQIRVNSTELVLRRDIAASITVK